jgi:hypothetical protein
MAGLGAKVERLSSIDAQLRMLVPGKVSEDDKLIEYDALLLDRFLDILQDLHGDDIKEMVPSIPLSPHPSLPQPTHSCSSSLCLFFFLFGSEYPVHFYCKF